MSLETERLVHEQAPTQEQLRNLAFIGVKSAVQRERLRTLNRASNAHYFVEEIDLLGDVNLEDVPVQMRHRLAMRVGVRPPKDGMPKIWSLKFLDTYSVEARPGEWQFERSTYRFEWTRSKTLMADRATRLVCLGDYIPDELDWYLDRFSIPNDAIDILAASEQLRMVTADDCDELTNEVTSYLNVVEGVLNQ